MTEYFVYVTCYHYRFATTIFSATQQHSNTASLNFFQAFFFPTAKVAYITAVIFLHVILHSAVHIYDFHNFPALQCWITMLEPFETTS